jgi:antitoxin (DNA-binding transcriptional repressor) of toxin-antitoxin stability system
MKVTNFTEFCKHAAEFLGEVEKGEVIRIFRHGKAIADITSVMQKENPSWKKVPPAIPLRGISLSKAILKNRK